MKVTPDGWNKVLEEKKPKPNIYFGIQLAENKCLNLDFDFGKTKAPNLTEYSDKFHFKDLGSAKIQNWSL